MAFVMGAALGAILGSFVTVVALALIWGESDRGRQQQKGAVAVRRHGPFLVSLEYPKWAQNPKYGQRVAVRSACFACWSASIASCGKLSQYCHMWLTGPEPLPMSKPAARAPVR